MKNTLCSNLNEEDVESIGYEYFIYTSFRVKIYVKLCRIFWKQYKSAANVNFPRITRAQSFLISIRHTSWVAVVTPIDRPKSVRNRCVFELFVALFVLSLCPFDISVVVGALS